MAKAKRKAKMEQAIPGKNVGGRKPVNEVKREKNVIVRVSAEWFEWIDGFAKSRGQSRSELLAHAAAHWATTVGYKGPPPR